MIVSIQEVYGNRRMRRFGVGLPPELDVPDPIRTVEEAIKCVVNRIGLHTMPCDSPRGESHDEQESLLAELIGGNPADAVREGMG